MHVVKPRTLNADLTPLGNKKQPSCKTHENQQPLVSFLILPSEIQVHTKWQHVFRNKLALNDLFQKFDPIISKSSNDTGQMHLIEMHITNKPGATPAHPYPLALKHHNFLKQDIKNLLDTGIICKHMSPWVNPIMVVKEHTPKGFTTTMKYCGSCLIKPKILSLWLSCLLQVSDWLTVVGIWHYGSAMPSIHLMQITCMKSYLHTSPIE